MRMGRVRLVGIHTEGTKTQVHCMLGRELLRNTQLLSMGKHSIDPGGSDLCCQETYDRTPISGHIG